MQNTKTISPSEFDEDGFLKNPDIWNKGVAEQLASLHGFFSLSEQQWSVISELRKFYLINHSTPPPRHICHINKMKHNCVANLFDNHGVEAWRIAGLPNPGEEVKSYM